MGCTLSSTTHSSPLPPGFDGVRVVHINGYVEDFPAPVTAGEITGKPPRLVLCSAAQLLCFGSGPLLRLDDRLEPGRLYFLLPPSVFQSDSSPADIATLVARLAAVARNSTGGTAAPNGSKSSSPVVMERGDVAVYVGGEGEGMTLASRRARSWKPVLDAIEEGSLGRSTIDMSNKGVTA